MRIASNVIKPMQNIWKNTEAHFANRKIVKNLIYLKEILFIKKSLRGKTCILQFRGGSPGLFSYVINSLGFVRYAHKRGMIPVIDLQSFETTYLSKEHVGEMNAWEYYFEQPCRIGLQSIKREYCEVYDISDFLKIEPTQTPSWDMNWWGCLTEGSLNNRMWRAYCHRYIKLSDKAINKLDCIYNNLIKDGDRVLGVLCRGTDYTQRRPSGHPVQPTAEMMIEKIDAVIKERGYNKIYLATEDKLIFNKFKFHYGEKIISIESNLIDYNGKSWINTLLPSDEQGKIDKGMDYLMSIMILSRCKAFIAGRTSGSMGVMLLTKGFEYSYFYDLGYY